ncbi:DUF2103 domain-containing protein [Desulfosporosinus meridiei]|uniref:Putative metal-binding protein (DUF2103) n=1 Tax=Desulfosporosinus meridiei (strain ATCC BAA-275 / DSM 13257 / KCTC 12902 / NCIMB 13706 / S10) TaxID=768704 RepID=J7IRR3_DESMD|nr:DUF2103 domain-containing protein [Desulfosporosinus meridiei]AFQ44572.1 putative metal-binding protein (DUF2103) [Desulfosporosinus meridiei DSM 13257]
MKHRRNKVKREHGIIQNALEWLENLSLLVEVTDIIPGVIDVNRSSERGIVYKYETQTGCKLLLKSSGSIQEAFVVTKYPQRIKEWVNKEFPSSYILTVEQDDTTSPNTINRTGKKPTKVWPKSRIKSESTPMAKGRRSKRRSAKKGLMLNAYSDDKSITVADQLDGSMRQALKVLKNSLEKQR